MALISKTVNPLELALEWSGMGRNVLLARFKDPGVLAGDDRTGLLKLFLAALPAGTMCLIYESGEATVLEGEGPECGDAEAFPVACMYESVDKFAVAKEPKVSDGIF